MASITGSGTTAGQFSGTTSNLGEVTALRADAAKCWAEAQTTESMLKMAGTEDVQIDGFARMFNRVKKRSLKLRSASVGITPVEKQNYDRRVLMTSTYEDADLADIDDLSISEVDHWAEVRDQMKAAAGRLCDQVVLFGLHSVVQEFGEEDETNYGPLGTQTVQTFLTSLKKKYRNNLYFAGSKEVTTGTGGTAVTTYHVADFKSDHIEDAIRIIRKRNVKDKLVAALTPDLSHALRTDTDFKSSERTFRPDEQIRTAGMYTGFLYKGVNFIPILDDVLVTPSVNCMGAKLTSGTPNAAQAAALSRLTIARDITKLAGDYAPVEGSSEPTATVNSAGTTVSAAADANGDAIAWTTAGSNATAVVSEAGIEGRILHLWVPKAMKFASRASRVISKMSERNDLSHAKQLYFRTDFGCLNIDSDYVVGLVTSGQILQ